MAAEHRKQTLDAGIIHALQADGRASIQDIAASLGAPRGAVSARLKHLLDSGTLRVFAAFDPSFAGQHVLVHSSVETSGPVTPVAEKIAALPETVFVSLVSGPAGVVFESRHSGLASLERVLATVRAFDGVVRLRSTTYTDVVKGFFVANYRHPVTIDDTDRALIRLLQRDGRASYRELAEQAGLAPSSARSRVARLLNANVIRISAVESRTDHPGRFSLGVGMNASGDDRAIVDLMLSRPEIDFSVRTYGRYDFVATITDMSSRAVYEILESLRALPAVTALETWTHLSVVKEDYERVALPSGSASADAAAFGAAAERPASAL